jgi:hypothetical protein
VPLDDGGGVDPARPVRRAHPRAEGIRDRGRRVAPEQRRLQGERELLHP